jgi:ERCC4 domain
MTSSDKFLVARNPERNSALPYLLHLPLPSGSLWLKAKESWPRAARVYCHPLDEAPGPGVEVLQRVDVTICTRRGPAIDLVLARGINKRSQFVYTFSRGRSVIFWQTAKTAQAARPGLRVPTSYGQIGTLFIDSRERYGYTFTAHESKTVRQALPVGDYGAMLDGHLVCVVERKTIEDFATSLVDGSLSFAMAELAALPAAAVAIEGTYSALLRYAYTHVGFIPELIARLLIRYPNVSINFLESRKVAEEWTYRYLTAAYANADALPLLATADS